MSSQVISCLWTLFEVPTATMRLLFSLVYGLIALTGLSGNGLIIFIWWRFRSVRTACNYLILSLSLADFFMEAKVIIFLINAYYGGPVLGIAGAKVTNPLDINASSSGYFCRSTERSPS